MSIVYVGTLPPHPGGSATLCAELLRGMAGEGHRIRAVAPMTADAARLPDTFASGHPEIRLTRYTVPHFETDSSAVSDSFLLEEERQVAKILDHLISEVRPSLIFLGRDSYAWYMPDLVWGYGIPLLLISHSGQLIHGVGARLYGEHRAQRLLKNYHRINQIVTPSRATRKDLERLGLSNIRVIPSGVDVERFALRPKDPCVLASLRIRPDDVIVSHISNLKRVKRPLDFVNAAQLVVRRMPNLIFLVVGDGSCRREMEELCKRKGITGSFRFTGWVEHERIPTFINLSDMVVLPSEIEVQALVWLETQACGRVIVSSDIPPALEVITDGETGLLFRKGDIHDLAAVILRAATDPHLRANIGQKAREHAQARPLQAAVAEYVTTCTRVIQDHRRSRGKPGETIARNSCNQRVKE